MVERIVINDDVKYVRPHRVKINLPPPIEFQWKGPFEGWARTWVKNNFWRVREVIGSEDDAMQECALIFARCCKSYRGKVNNPAWMMALFKRAVINDWNTFAVKDGKMRATPPPDPSDAIDHNPGFLLAAMSEASAEVQTVLKAIGSAPSEFLSILFHKQEELLSDDPAKVAKAELLLNRRLRRLLGISSVDIVSELRALLR